MNDDPTAYAVTVWACLCAAVIVLLLTSCAADPDLVDEPDPAACDAWCWEQVEERGWSSTEYEECREGCGETG